MSEPGARIFHRTLRINAAAVQTCLNHALSKLKEEFRGEPLDDSREDFFGASFDDKKLVFTLWFRFRRLGLVRREISVEHLYREHDELIGIEV